MIPQKHGMSGSPFYRKWSRIIRVCTDTSSDRYEFYGGRGIKCKWNNFIEFRNDMYASYLKHLEEFGHDDTTIDRIDNNGHYSKENCRWATRSQQFRNRRSRKEVTWKGKTKSVTEWAEHLNVPKVALWLRLNRYGWSINDSMTKPFVNRRK